MPTVIHRMSGFLPSGQRVRACCSCGYATTPRASEQRALDALTSAHESTPPVCALCGRTYEGSWMLLSAQLAVLTDPSTGDQFLACRDMPRSCRDGARRKLAQLDRAVADSWGLPEIGRPRLRVVGGTDHRPTGGQS